MYSSSFRDFWLISLDNDVFLSLKIVLILENSVDSDDMQHYAAFHQGLHCLPKHPFNTQRVKGDSNI